MKGSKYVAPGLSIGLSVLITLIYPLLGVILFSIGIIMLYNNRKKSSKTELNSHNDVQSDDISNSTTRIRFNVMGLKYEGRNELVHSYVSSKAEVEENGHRVLKEYDTIVLKDENNEHDPNAIAIYHDKMGKLGYVPKDTTHRVKSLLKTSSDHTINIRYSEQNKGEYIATVRITTPLKS